MERSREERKMDARGAEGTCVSQRERSVKGIVSGCIRACTYSNAYSIFGRAISARPARSRRDRSRGSLFYAARFLYSIQPRFLSPDEPDTRNTPRPDAPPSYPLKNSFSRASARRDAVFRLRRRARARTPFPRFSVFFGGVH